MSVCATQEAAARADAGPCCAQVDGELQQFLQSSIALQNVATQFATSGRALEGLSEQKVGKHVPSAE